MKDKGTKDNSRHVVPNPNGGWDNKHAGAKRASSHHETQRAAIAAATAQAKKEGSELKIHGRNGQIRESNSYGNDPRNIPG